MPTQGSETVTGNSTKPTIRGLATSLLVVAFVTLLFWEPRTHVEASRSRQESLAIVVNLENPTDEITLPELRAVFLGERSHWPNGRRITLVMMEPGQPERDALLREVCRMSDNDFRRHFLQGIFTGQVLVSPKTLATPVGVRKFIFNVPGAIGYLRPEDVDATVKVLRIGGRLPVDPDYALRILDRRER